MSSSALDFHATELNAMRLEGDVFDLHGVYIPADSPDVLATRVAIARAGAPLKLILDGRSAAWAWGATNHFPAHPELCSNLFGRTTKRHDGYKPARTVRLNANDVIETDGGTTVSPWRTTVHLLRWQPNTPSDTFRQLLAIDSLTVADGFAKLAAERRARQSSLAIETYRRIFRMELDSDRQSQASVTRYTS